MGRIAVAAIVSSWVIPISIIVNRIVSEPYMDEIFHIPQAQQYCKGNFRSWDPMITTPPGLYYLSLAHVASLFPGMFYLKAISSFPEVCSIPILRSINGILAILCSILIYEIITNLRPTLDERKATVYAVVLSMYPLHWFFTFLYYTDVASLTAVLAMYLACLRKNYWFSGLLGALAVVIRQTNIIWMLFVACSGIIDLTFACKRDKIDIGDGDASIKYLGQQASMDGAVFRSSLRKRKINTPVDTGIQPMPTKNASSKASISGLIDEIETIFLTALHIKWKLFVSFIPFFILLAAFALSQKYSEKRQLNKYLHRMTAMGYARLERTIKKATEGEIRLSPPVDILTQALGKEEYGGRLRDRGKGYTVTNVFHTPKPSSPKKTKSEGSGNNAVYEMLLKGLVAIIRNSSSSSAAQVVVLISVCGIDILSLTHPADAVPAPGTQVDDLPWLKSPTYHHEVMGSSL
nr:dol-P-Glc:Glc(2)Man(9)GlcNAc(2)-PP-Dol alpha-1,2-glucosyltransferase-like [Ziziphus jujuba var. spinosa]